MLNQYVRTCVSLSLHIGMEQTVTSTEEYNLRGLCAVFCVGRVHHTISLWRFHEETRGRGSPERW